jgi:hypothetical protein
MADYAEMRKRAEAAQEAAVDALRATAEPASGPRPVGRLAELTVQLANDVLALLSLLPQPPTYTCPHCGMVSRDNAEDIRSHYCRNCDRYDGTDEV